MKFALLTAAAIVIGAATPSFAAPMHPDYAPHPHMHHHHGVMHHHHIYRHHHRHHNCIGLGSGTAHHSCGSMTGGPAGGLH